MNSWMRALPLVIALLVAPAIAGALEPTEGSYISAEGTETIELKKGEGSITVVEQNMTSVYTRQADGTFHFLNPETKVLYGIRVVDAGTLEAFKPGTNNPPTRLLIRKSPAAPKSEAEEKDADAALALVMKYTALAQTDSDNAHVWAACGAAAMAKTQLSPEGFAEYAKTSAATLKPIMVDASRTPCDDAIPAAIWVSAGH